MGQYPKVIYFNLNPSRNSRLDMASRVLHEVCTSAKCKKPLAMWQQDPVLQADQRNGQNRAPIGSRQTDTNRKICEWIKNWLPPAHMFLPIACAVIYAPPGKDSTWYCLAGLQCHHEIQNPSDTSCLPGFRLTFCQSILTQVAAIELDRICGNLWNIWNRVAEFVWNSFGPLALNLKLYLKLKKMGLSQGSLGPWNLGTRKLGVLDV